MSRYIALLRGVSPSNAKMADLKVCFEQLGFTDVRTILSSGNVAFNTTEKNESNLITAIEAGMTKHLARSFPVILRSTDYLTAMLNTDPYSVVPLLPNEKRVVTFLNQTHKERLIFPIELDGARILAMKGREVFTVYVAHERGPIFMTLIEKTFGKAVTTRTWDTIKKCAVA
jgi:uncharacterized protein (DUF1697 family)